MMTLDELHAKYPPDIFPDDYNVEDILSIDNTKNKIYTPKLVQFFTQDKVSYDTLRSLSEEYRLLSYRRKIQRDINQYENFDQWVSSIRESRNRKAKDFAIPYNDDTIIYENNDDMFIVKLRSPDEVDFYSKAFVNSDDVDSGLWEQECIEEIITWYFIIDFNEPYGTGGKFMIFKYKGVSSNQPNDMIYSDGDHSGRYNVESDLQRLGIDSPDNFFEPIELDELDDDLFSTYNVLARAGYTEDDYKKVETEGGVDVIDFMKNVDLYNLYVSSGGVFNPYEREVETPFNINKVNGDFIYAADVHRGEIEFMPSYTDVPNEVTGDFNYSIYSPGGSMFTSPKIVGGDCDVYIDVINELRDVSMYFPEVCGGSVIVAGTLESMYDGNELDFSHIKKIEGNISIDLDNLDDSDLASIKIVGVDNIQDRILGDIIINGNIYPKNLGFDNMGYVKVGEQFYLAIDDDFDPDFSLDDDGFKIGLVDGSVIIRNNLNSFLSLPRFIRKDLIIKSTSATDIENLPYVGGRVEVPGITQQEYDKIKDGLYRKNSKFDVKSKEVEDKIQNKMFESTTLKYIKPFDF